MRDVDKTETKMGFADPLTSFFRDLFSDLKSSRRFQVGTVLWIPLIVTAAVLTVRFGIENTLMTKFHEWKHTFIAESSFKFPDMLMYFDNPNGFYPNGNSVPICTQPGVATSSSVYGVAKPCPFPWVMPNGNQCYNFQFSQYSTSGINQYQYHIQCLFRFQPDVGQDNMIRVFTPGGFETYSGWNQESDPVRPNMAVALHLEPEWVMPMNSAPFLLWHRRTHYESTVFTGNSPTPYNTTMWIRIPFTVIRASWEHNGFDSWILMAMWGGGFFFFYFLHSIIFAVLKLWLPNDSKLIPAPTTGSEYTPITQ